MYWIIGAMGLFLCVVLAGRAHSRWLDNAEERRNKKLLELRKMLQEAAEKQID
jgi:hypothetical protein